MLISHAQLLQRREPEAEFIAGLVHLLATGYSRLALAYPDVRLQHYISSHSMCSSSLLVAELIAFPPPSTRQELPICLGSLPAEKADALGRLQDAHSLKPTLHAVEGTARRRGERGAGQQQIL